jgi:methionyl-tRNA formyltransferase
MNVLLLGPKRQELIDFLIGCGERVNCTEEKIGLKDPYLQEADFLISYGYRHIIKKEILNQFLRKAINIHISLLPWNRGADPNLWSILENTPKGVTIHYLDEGLDTGDILVQEQTEFSQEDTLRTSYSKLSQIALSLFKRYWIHIKDGTIKPKPQSSGGSYHRLQDRTHYEHLLIHGWDTPIKDLIGKALDSKDQ